MPTKEPKSDVVYTPLGRNLRSFHILMKPAGTVGVIAARGDRGRVAPVRGRALGQP